MLDDSVTFSPTVTLERKREAFSVGKYCELSSYCSFTQNIQHKISDETYEKTSDYDSCLREEIDNRSRPRDALFWSYQAGFLMIMLSIYLVEKNGWHAETDVEFQQ